MNHLLSPTPEILSTPKVHLNNSTKMDEALPTSGSTLDLRMGTFEVKVKGKLGSHEVKWVDFYLNYCSYTGEQDTQA